MHTTSSNTNSSTINSTASSSSPSNDDQTQSTPSDEKATIDDEQPIGGDTDLEQNDLDQSQTDYERCSDINLTKESSPLIEDDETISSDVDPR